MKELKIIDMRSLPGDSAFLIDDGETSILYDSGFAFTGFKVAENIKKYLGERSLNYIFLTHSHYDHALGSAYVKEYYPKALVAAGEYAAKIFMKDSAKKVMRELDRKFAEENGITEYTDLIDELAVDIPLKDGDIIKAGEMEFKAISLPGHTRCSVAFYNEERKLLLGSETTGVYYCEGEITPAFLIGFDITLKSIRKLKEYSIDNILLPHFGLADKKHTEYYLMESENIMRDTAENILKILKSGGNEKDALNYFKERFYKGYVTKTYPLAAMELNTSIMIGIVKKELME